MRIIARRRLESFWSSGAADAEEALRAWYQEVKAAEWSGPADVKQRFPSASLVGGETIVFNIRGNRYRLVVRVWYPGQEVYIKFIGTHADYDKLDVKEL